MPHTRARTGDSAPFSDQDTSLEAARLILIHLERLEAIVLVCIQAAGSHGACDHEIEAALGLSHQTASARRRALVLKGLVWHSGAYRKTPSGRRAKAWVLHDKYSHWPGELASRGRG